MFDRMGSKTDYSIHEKNQSRFYWSKRQWVAVASAGQYASLHHDLDR